MITWSGSLGHGFEEDFRTRRESRKQLEKLKALVEARKKNEEDRPAREKNDEETQT